MARVFGTMHCTRCGKPNQEGALFCWNCGGDLAESRPPQSAPDVGESGPTLVETNDAPPGADFAAGTLIDGRYRIERQLGRGGMGWVWLTRDVKLDLAVVLKFISPALGQSASIHERFLREAKLCLTLTHPGIVRLYHIGEWRGQAYLAMEYLEGPTLGAWLESRKQARQTPSWPDLADVLAQLAEALSYAHQAGVIHRDLKPANIILTGREGGRPRVVVLDFGLAKAIGAAGPTRLGAALGTPFYMAPEQAREGGQVDQRADIYSIGAIAYEMLTGRVPLGRLVAPRQLFPTLPAEVEGWILGALEPEAEARQAKLGQLVELLRTPPAARPEVAKAPPQKAAAGATAAAAGTKPPEAAKIGPPPLAGARPAGAAGAAKTGAPPPAGTATPGARPKPAASGSGWATLFYIILFCLLVYGYWHRAKMLQHNGPAFRPLPVPTPFKWLGPQPPKNNEAIKTLTGQTTPGPPLPTAMPLGPWRGDDGANNFVLGQKYQRGEGVAKDDAVAAKLYRKSAEAGYADGMDSLGTMYQNGQGVPQDDGQALYWYRKAAEGGSSSGMNDLGWMYQNGRAVAKDSAQAVEWFSRAAEAGNPYGMYNLGLMYENGEGIAKHPALALMWYERAASLGKADAQEKVRRLKNLKK